MALVKKSNKKGQRLLSGFSWVKLLIAASVVLNIGFIVVMTVVVTSNAFDWTLADQGLVRYCATANDSKFEGMSKQDLALRDFTCARDDAQAYFKDGFQKYLTVKGITTTSNQ
jgi:hypothetical protein